MIHFGWIRREWLALHESDAKYFMVCIYIVAPSMKLSFFEQCIEIFTSMGVGELVRTHPPTRPSIRNDPFWLDTSRMACSTRIRCKIFYGMHLCCSAIDETIVLREMH